MLIGPVSQAAKPLRLLLIEDEPHMARLIAANIGDTGYVTTGAGGVPILGMAPWMLFSPYLTWTDVAAASAERLVAASLVRAVNAALERRADGAERQRLFHANVAHELRTPVAILQTRLDSMPDLARGHELRRDVMRIVLLVEQLLAVERLGATRRPER
jgi:signal transduction histidine kinase